MKATEKTFNGLRISGFIALFLLLALSGLCCYLIADTNETWSVITGIVGLCLLVVCLLGFMEIEPNNARVMLFFGKYKGTITDNGFFWVNPLYSKKKITLRARNLDVPPIKVNDKVGNPVMIGAVMVWKVKDTYKAMFDIDSSSISISSNKSFISLGESSELSQRMQNYENFVQIQSDAAIRKIAGMYAYDYNESKDPVTLRSDDGEVAQKLEEELNSRLAIGGIGSSYQLLSVCFRDRRSHVTPPASGSHYRRKRTDRGGSGQHGSTRLEQTGSRQCCGIG